MALSQRRIFISARSTRRFYFVNFIYNKKYGRPYAHDSSSIRAKQILQWCFSLVVRQKQTKGHAPDSSELRYTKGRVGHRDFS